MLSRPNFGNCGQWLAFIVIFSTAPLVGSLPAAVTTVGSVTPVPPSTGGTFTGSLIVGDEQAPGSDIGARLQIDQGTALQYGTLIVGDDEEFFGEVNLLGTFLTGLNAQLTLTGVGSNAVPTVQVGRDGFGDFNIRGGATVTLTNVTSSFSIGVSETGVGSVLVSDPFTVVTLQNDLVVGKQGIGRLEIVNGALVRTRDNGFTRAVRIGSDATSVGTLVVDGDGSILRGGSNLIVGDAGQGTLSIKNNAFVDIDNTPNATITVGRFGRIELDNGTLVGNKPATGFGTTVDGFLGGSGLVRTSVNFSDSSIVRVGPDDVLRFDGDVSNNGSINIDGGELRFLAGFTNNDLVVAPPSLSGRINISDGTIHFFEPLTNIGVISAARGVVNFHGEIDNEGSVVIARDVVAIFNDVFSNSSGTISLLPQSNALFLADSTFASNGLVDLGVTADDSASELAQLRVLGGVTLDGDLSVSVDADYTPTLGDSFILISAGDGIAGAFDHVTLPELSGGLEFGLLYGANSVMMAVQIDQHALGLSGDYDRDGTVDAADYVVWRNQRGGSTSLPNDDTPGVGQDDYVRWRANFGRTSEVVVGSTSAVNPGAPEPSALFLTALAILPVGFAWRLRRP